MKLTHSLIAQVFLICFSMTGLNAQQDTFSSVRLMDVYNKEVISYGTRYIRDNEKLKFREVETLLLKYPESSAEYSRYKKKRNLSRLIGLSTGIMASLIITNNDSDGAIQYVYAAGGIGLGVTGTILMRQSYSHLQNSLWLYNRDVLMK
jgi:hypothetical protein